VARVRLGVAILLDARVAGEVDGLRRACGDPMLDRVPPHLTLVPPVNVRVDGLPAVLASVRRAAATTSPFSLTIGPAATFHPATPVVYLAVGGERATTALPALRHALRVGPFDRPEPWSFVPHVTLTDGVDADRVAAMVLGLSDYHVETEASRVHVLEEGDDRVWRPIADAPFGPERLVGRGGLEIVLTISETVDPEAAATTGAGAGVPAAPPGARPLVVTARLGGFVVGVLVAWTRDGSGSVVLQACTPEGEDAGVAGHLAAAAAGAAADRGCDLPRAAPGAEAS
jgi:2'-5' RNA ligase